MRQVHERKAVSRMLWSIVIRNTFIASVLVSSVVGSNHGTLSTTAQHNTITTATPLTQPRRGMEGLGNIVLPVEPDDALCDIDVMTQRAIKDEALSNADVDFWYAVGTTQFGKKDRILFELNQWIYKSMQETNVWCTPFFNNETQTSSPLGVVTFIPSKSTTFDELSCQVSDFVNASDTGISDCRVILGTFQMLGQPKSTIETATASIQMEVEQAIAHLATTSNSNTLLQGVQIFSFLGNTKDEASAFLASLTRPPPNDGLNVGGIENNESPNEDSTRTGLIVGLTIPFIGLLLAAIFWKKRPIVVSLLPPHNALQSWEEYDPKSNNVRGTGDPPDSYHDGLYHHMFDGQKYLSTRCLLCLETRRNTKMVMKSSPAMETHTMGLEKTSQDADEFATFPIVNATSNMKLGQPHMGMDVHVCSSATCVRCFPKDEVEPMFVPTGIRKHQPEPPSPANSSGSSLSSGSEFLPIESVDPYDIESLGATNTTCTEVQLPIAPPRRGRFRRK